MGIRSTRALLATAVSAALVLSLTPGLAVAAVSSDRGGQPRSDARARRLAEARAAAKTEPRATAASGVAAASPDAREKTDSGVRPADASDPDDLDFEHAVAISLETVYDRTFSPPGDTDFFKFTLQAGHTYSIWVDESDTTVDPLAILYTPDEDFIVENDERRLDGSLPGCLIRYTPGTTGTYYLEVWDFTYDEGYPGGGSYSVEINDNGTGYAPGTMGRMAGADRYAVASNVGYEANGRTWAGIDTVIIASGADAAAADPLTAGSLAGVFDAPILLINQASTSKQLPGATRNAISAIRAANTSPIKFYLVGGTGSNPDWVRQRILAIAPNATFERMSGIDRYACSARIAREVREESGAAPTTCFVANGETNGFFYDALAAAPVAYGSGWPILLCRKSSIPGSTRTEVANYATRYVVGNTWEVNTANVVTPLGATRIGDSIGSYYDRNYVARRFSEYAIDHSWADSENICVVNKLADALTGGTLAGSQDGVILYVQNLDWIGIDTEAFVQMARLDINNCYMIGGTASMPDDTVGDQLRELIGYPGSWIP